MSSHHTRSVWWHYLNWSLSSTDTMLIEGCSLCACIIYQLIKVNHTRRQKWDILTCLLKLDAEIWSTQGNWSRLHWEDQLHSPHVWSVWSLPTSSHVVGIPCTTYICATIAKEGSSSGSPHNALHSLVWKILVHWNTEQRDEVGHDNYITWSPSITIRQC